MTTISLVLIHNRGDIRNAEQIQAISPQLTQHDQESPALDEHGTVIGTYTTHYFTLNGLSLDHQIKVFQIVPYGVTVDHDALYSLDSHKVFYGAGDEDKVGNHPRFFNYAMRYAIDSLGADVVMLVTDHTAFTVADLKAHLSLRTIDFIQPAWGFIATTKLFRQIGEISESGTLADGIAGFLPRIAQGGLRHG